MFFIHPAPHDHHADIPARHDRPGRSLLPALCLAAVAVLGGIVTAPVAATSEPVPSGPTPTDERSVKIPTGDVQPGAHPGQREHQLWLVDQPAERVGSEHEAAHILRVTYYAGRASRVLVMAIDCA